MNTPEATLAMGCIFACMCGAVILITQPLRNRQKELAEIYGRGR